MGNNHDRFKKKKKSSLIFFLFLRWYGKQKRKVILVGLENSGKTGNIEKKGS